MPWNVPTHSGALGTPSMRLDAAAHLARGLVGERHRQDAVRRHVLDLHQPGDPMRQHARLAAAGAGQHQRRRERRGHGRALRVVETAEDGSDVHEGPAFYRDFAGCSFRGILFPDSVLAAGGIHAGLCAQISTLDVLRRCCSRLARVSPSPQRRDALRRRPMRQCRTSAAPTTEQQSAPAQPEPPAESSLVDQARRRSCWRRIACTFRPCDEKAELWLLDQSDGMLRETFADEMQKGPAMLYIEAYGERAPVSEDIAEARAYAGTFVLEEVLYAGVQGQVRGCDEPAANYIVTARGNEPFWAVEVGESRHRVAPAAGAEGDRAGSAADAGRRRRSALSRSGNGHELELLVDAQTCRDAMSGEFFAYSARAVLDGKEFSGCARVGR